MGCVHSSKSKTQGTVPKNLAPTLHQSRPDAEKLKVTEAWPEVKKADTKKKATETSDHVNKSISDDSQTILLQKNIVGDRNQTSVPVRNESLLDEVALKKTIEQTKSLSESPILTEHIDENTNQSITEEPIDESIRQSIGETIDESMSHTIETISGETTDEASTISQNLKLLKILTIPEDAVSNWLFPPLSPYTNSHKMNDDLSVIRSKTKASKKPILIVDASTAGLDAFSSWLIPPQKKKKHKSYNESQKKKPIQSKSASYSHKSQADFETGKGSDEVLVNPVLDDFRSILAKLREIKLKDIERKASEKRLQNAEMDESLEIRSRGLTDSNTTFSFRVEEDILL